MPNSPEKYAGQITDAPGESLSRIESRQNPEKEIQEQREKISAALLMLEKNPIPDRPGKSPLTDILNALLKIIDIDPSAEGGALARQQKKEIGEAIERSIQKSIDLEPGLEPGKKDPATMKILAREVREVLEKPLEIKLHKNGEAKERKQKPKKETGGNGHKKKGPEKGTIAGMEKPKHNTEEVPLASGEVLEKPADQKPEGAPKPKEKIDPKIANNRKKIRNALSRLMESKSALGETKLQKNIETLFEAGAELGLDPKIHGAFKVASLSFIEASRDGKRKNSKADFDKALAGIIAEIGEPESKPAQEQKASPVEFDSLPDEQLKKVESLGPTLKNIGDVPQAEEEKEEQALKPIFREIAAKYPGGFKETDVYPLEKVTDLSDLYEALQKIPTLEYLDEPVTGAWAAAMIKDTITAAEHFTDSKEKLGFYAQFFSRFNAKAFRQTLERLLVTAEPDLFAQRTLENKERYEGEIIEGHIKYLKGIAKGPNQKDKRKKYVEEMLQKLSDNSSITESFPNLLGNLQKVLIDEGFLEDPDAKMQWKVFSEINTLSDLEQELLKNNEIEWKGKTFNTGELLNNIKHGIETIKSSQNTKEFREKSNDLSAKVPSHYYFRTALRKIIAAEMILMRKSRGVSKSDGGKSGTEPEEKPAEESTEMQGPMQGLPVQGPVEEINIPVSEKIKQWVATHLGLSSERVANLSHEEAQRLANVPKPPSSSSDIGEGDETGFGEEKGAGQGVPTEVELSPTATTMPTPESEQPAGVPKEQTIEAKMPARGAYGYSEGSKKTIPEMMDSGNFNEFLTNYNEAPDLIANQDVEGIRAIYEVWGIRDKAIKGYHDFFKDYYKDTLKITLDSADLTAINDLLAKEAFEDPQKFMERAKNLIEFVPQEKEIRKLESKIPGLEEKMEQLTKEKEKIEGEIEKRPFGELVRDFIKNRPLGPILKDLFSTSEADKKRKEQLEKIEMELEKLQSGASSLEEMKQKREVFRDKFNNIRTSILEEAGIGAMVGEIAKKKAQDRLKALMSGEKADFNGAQTYLESLMQARDVHNTDVFDDDMDEAQIQENLDKALEERTRTDVESTLKNFSLGNKSFSRFQDALKRAVKNTSPDRLGSKGKNEVRDFLVQTLEGLEKTLGTDAQSKAKRQLIIATLATMNS